MIRFFGIILGVVLIANIAVTAHNNNYDISSVITMGKEIGRMASETIDKISKTRLLTLQDTDQETGGTRENMATVPAPVDMATLPLEIQRAQDEQLTEPPSEVRIFWGPFQTKTAARGFANMAEAMGDLPTEVIEKNLGRHYVAFVGQSEAIDSAIVTFAERTGMRMEQDYAL